MEAALAMLSGWGRTRKSPSVTLRPADMADALTAFGDPVGRAHGLIAHAAGRAYGDCALNDQGSAVLTSGLNRILSFDPASGVVEVEPGVTFRQLVDEFLPRGFMVPVSPGTGFATIGGAVANDVHGKNHEQAGSFCNHVEQVDLLTPSGRVHTIGPGVERRLFEATCGGLGLTGLLTRIRFRMKPVPGPAVLRRVERVGDLDAFLAAMQAREGASYSVGWIDGTARGRGLGRGILETAEPVADAVPRPSGRALKIPFNFPDIALNPLSIRAFNELYFYKAPAAPCSLAVRYEKFLYPLDALHEWNRIYGVRGFYQFQNVVPFEAGPAALRELLEVIAGSRRASFLAVLKRLGAGQGISGPLSFPMPGYTLALDFPAGTGIEALYERLVGITLKYGGRVYLAKDALLRAAAFREMYPRWREFLGVLEEIDPKQRLQSDMSRRLRLRERAA
jgi:decaprenylphospho-beta-D-ribofuranose 2-oxidase